MSLLLLCMSNSSVHHLYDFNSAAGSINSHGHPPTFRKDDEEEEFVSGTIKEGNKEGKEGEESDGRVQ